MRRNLGLLVLAVVTAVVVVLAVALHLSQEQNAPLAGNGEPMLPALMAKVNDVRLISGRSKAGAFTLDRKKGRWVVREAHDYPAQGSKVRELVLGLAELKRVEAKTKNPALYGEVGVARPPKSGAWQRDDGLLVTLQGAKGAVLASLLVGKDQPGVGDPTLDDYFVRKPAKARVWLVEGKLPHARTPIDWLDKTILDIPRGRFARIAITHSDGKKVVVRRGAAKQPHYVLDGVPAGDRIKSAYAVDSIADEAMDLSFDDVQPADTVESGATPAFTAVLSTRDGLRVRLSALRKGDVTWARLNARAETPAKPPVKAKAAEKDGLLAPLAVRKEAAMLNERWKGWAYKLSSYRSDTLGTRMRDLVELTPVKGGTGKS